ncbi:hypothetical protein OSB04_005506 [Centaurea solstitialis]|uniref:Tf2-1-like SH3-like domain-containing protein n=1 Tax=Centaurea solstitialis TaxID=347529 RepID=A0AA38WS54_9ASTR|nr:hypothetical protein OSB04_005506 [Centaurea solstitialis]
MDLLVWEFSFIPLCISVFVCNSQHIGPFKITKRIGEVAYKLELPDELRGVHNTFHVSNLGNFWQTPPTGRNRGVCCIVDLGYQGTVHVLRSDECSMGHISECVALKGISFGHEFVSCDPEGHLGNDFISCDLLSHLSPQCTIVGCYIDKTEMFTIASLRAAIAI